MRSALFPALFCSAAASAAPLQKIPLVSNLRDPMSLATAPDGDIYLVEREGRLLRIRPSTGGVFEIGQLPVSALRAIEPKSNSAVEDGLHGIALDPEFAKNQRLYLYYSHPEKRIDRLSRFTLKDGRLDTASELVLLDVPVERDHRVCHHGGSVQFGPDGLLYLSIGDNTNPFESNGYAPIDNREGRAPWDAQGGAGNTNDLRGKILRIRPTETGYDIPPGNLFPPGTPKTRPEIFVMGCRNPFRISLDPETGALFWGDVGPDARAATERGPVGCDEINRTSTAGNFGWPFLIADNKPYALFDFASGKVLAMTDPASPKNPGIRNTGLTDLPPGRPAFIWYPYVESPEFPAMEKGGRNAMAGPVVRHVAGRKYNLIEPMEGAALLTYDWVRGKLWKARLGGAEKPEDLVVFDSLSPRPIELEAADDGSLWAIDYGTEWYFNRNGRLLRVIPGSANRPPSIEIEAVAEKENTYAVKSVSDPENDPVSVTWWLTTGVTERRLGTGSTITVPAGEGGELRAVASDGNGPESVARISFVKDQVLPEMVLKLTKNPRSVGFGEPVGFSVTTDTPLAKEDLSVRARYIPPSGHDSGGPRLSDDITARLTANQCFACHQVDVTSVGPRYMDVALRYRDRPDAVELLKAKLRNGGGGAWGEVPMPPQVALKDDDAGAILHAILGLAEGVSETRGSDKGTLELAPKPADAEPGGAWEFSAEAPGFTAARFRIPAK